MPAAPAPSAAATLATTAAPAPTTATSAQLRALLLTDVVDSTRLAQSLGDVAMAQVWLAHDRAARDLLPVWRGREIDKTDGMLLLFDHAADAVGYALAYHRALASLAQPLQARAGLHVGPVLLRSNSAEDVARGAKPLEVEGLAKPTVARLMGLARGGQTLLSAEARADLGRSPLKLRCHGHWMAKGVVEPLELFEVGEDHQALQAPAEGDKAWRVVQQGDWWMPVAQIPNNLPQQATRFVGRQQELDDLVRLLPAARLVTLVGMGGMGKTRLTLQVAAELMHHYPDGVWFLDLAPIQLPERVLGLAAQLLGLGDEPDRALLHTLCAHLRQKRVLFILDNCEHLIRACAELAYAIVQAAPWVHLLATSREGLHIPAERSYPIVALPLPAPGASLQGLLHSPAVQLFVDRARQHQPAFTPQVADAATLAQLVGRLEGIPLAIELAAARLRAMGLADILARLDDRFKLLSRGARGQQPRQQTLRALVDWSHGLLAPDEQTLFMRLGVFVGGFDLAAAEAVCAAEPLCADDVLDLLSALVEKSLVLLDDAGAPSARYRLLETLRDYARERLAQAGAQGPTAQGHALHFLAFAKSVGPGLRGPEHAHWIRRTEQELGNLRAAMALALAGGIDPLLAVKMAVPLQGFWLLRGHATEGRAQLAAALALPEVQASDMAHAWALYVAAALAGSQSDHAQARQMLEQCLLLRRRLGQPADLAATLSTLAWTRLQLGDAEGAGQGEREALAMFEQLGDVQGQAIGHLHLGQVAMVQADDGLARQHLQQAWALASGSGNPELQAESQLSLGMLAFDSGQPAAASSPLALSLSLAQAAGDTRGVALARWWLGRNQLALGQLDEAAQHLQFSLPALRQLEVWDALLGCLQDHARLAWLRGDAAAALRLLSACARARQRLGLCLPARQQQQLQALYAQVAHAMGAEQTAGSGGQGSDHATDHASLWAQGQGWDIDDAVQQASAG